MKFNYVHILSFFMLLTVGVFTSCSSLNNDSKNNDTNAAFIGEWKLVKATFTGEVATPADFEGFVIELKSDKSYVITNPLAFPSPAAALAGAYQNDEGFLTFDATVSVRLATLSGNSMTWEWEVAKPGKITATYRYTFERM